MLACLQLYVCLVNYTYCCVTNSSILIRNLEKIVFVLHLDRDLTSLYLANQSN